MRYWIPVLLLLRAPAVVGQDDAAGVKLFEEKVGPILQARCFKCHGPQTPKPKAGLRLDSREAALKGGDGGPAIVDMLVSSTSITTYAKQKTVAEEGVSNQIAYIRSLDYNSQIGLSGGNPAGIISASQTFNGVNGETLGVPATMTTDIEWASANVPGSAGTGADRL